MIKKGIILCLSLLMVIPNLTVQTAAEELPEEEVSETVSEEETQEQNQDESKVVSSFELPVNEIETITEEEWAEIIEENKTDNETEETAEESVPVSFVSDLQDLSVLVYKLEEDGTKTYMMPGDDGAYHLTPATYSYSASSDGFETVNDEFTVNAEDAEPLEIAVNLKQLETAEETVVPAEEETVPESLSWKEYLAENAENAESLTKEEYASLYAEFELERLNLADASVNAAGSASSGSFGNDYIEVAVANTGRFTIGTRRGNPNYTSDDNHKLLYGHPSPGTSETLIVIGDSYEEFFSADATSYSDRHAVAVMYIDSYDVVITQTLSLFSSGSSSFEDTIKIEYKAVNNGDSSQEVGIRIMLDTMIASNDAAPFKIPGTGNLTTCKTYTGSAIPASYQVYDDLNNPTTLGTGYLKRSGERNPDKVQFCYWGNIRSSGWNYSVSDGSSLGDSAVGIYFNRTEVKSKKSMAVSTYYGVGVGTALSGGTGAVCSVQGDKIKFIVKDAATDQPVADVKVSASYTSPPTVATTDQDGAVMFDMFSDDMFPDVSAPMERTPVNLSISKDGYKTQTYSKLVSRGSIGTLYIGKDGTPVLTGAFYGETDLLSQTVNFIEDVNERIERGKVSNTGTAEFMVTSDMEDCVFYFMQDERVIQKNKTGIFSLKTLKTNGGTMIEELTSQGNRYVKCVSKDGVTSKKLKIGIKVSYPSTVTSGFDDETLGPWAGFADTLTLGDVWPSGKAPIAEGTLAALFLGDSIEFGPFKKAEDLKLKFEITEDNTWRVGLNLEKIPKTEKDKQDLFESFSKAAKNSRAREKLNKKYGIKPSKVSMGSIHPFFSIYGYGEGQVENGTLVVDLVVNISGGAEAEYTTNYFWVVPLYITVGGELSGSLEAKANLHNSEGIHFRIYSGVLTPAFSLWLEGGVGTKGIANLGVEGKATIKADINFVAQSILATLSGAATLKAAVWLFEKELPLAETTIKLYDSNDSPNTVYGGDYDIWEAFDSQPYKLRASQPAAANIASVQSEETSADTIGTTEYSNPKIVSAGGKQYKFWIYNDPELQVSNSSTLVYSVLQDGSWSEQTPLTDDGTSDFYFDAAADDQYLYVVWHNSNQLFDDSTVTLDDMTNAADISFARISLETGETETVRLTEDSEMDTMPAVTVIDGTAYVAWYHSANATLENTLPNYVYYTSVTDNVCGEIQSVNCGSSLISKMAASVISGKPIATYTLDAGESLQESILTTHTLDMQSGQTAQSEEDCSGSVAGEIDGETKLFWFENGNIAYADSLSAAPSYVFSEDNLPEALPREFITAVHNGMTYLIWTANESEESNYKNAVAVRYKDGIWSSPFVLCGLTNGNISSMSTYENEEGNLVLSYLAVNYDETGALISSGMEETVITENTSFVLESIDYELADVIPGQELPLVLSVTNTGNEQIDELHVAISSDVQDEYSADLSNLNLAPGTSVDCKIEGFIPAESLADGAAGSVYTYNVDITSQSGETASDSLKLGYVDIAISNEQSIIFDNQEHLPVYLTNLTGFAAHNVHVRVLADSEDGTLIYDEIIEEIPAFSNYCIYVNIDSLYDTDRLYTYITSDSALAADGTYSQAIYISDETIVVLGDGNLTVNATAGGTVEDVSGQYVCEDEIQLHAQADPDYSFDCWTSDRPVEFADASDPDTVMSMVEGDVTVTANFVRNTDKDFSLSESELTMKVHDQAELKAIFEDNIPGKIIWSSSDETIAAVSSRGLVSALKAGEAVITASCGTYVHTCNIKVEDVPVEEIRVVYPSVSLSGIGATAEIETLITPEKASSPLIWTTSDASIVTVSDTGLATAVGYGTAYITATVEEDGSILGVCTVTVLNTLTTISVEPSEVTLDLSVPENREADVSVVFTPEDTTDEKTIEWTNYADSIVSIESSGDNNENLHITAEGIGQAMIRAKTAGDLEAWVLVNVICSPTGIVMNTESSEEEPYQVYTGRSFTASASLLPSNAQGTISWRSSDTSVAQVDSNGYVRGISQGDAVITAYCGELEADLYVAVRNDEVIVTSLDDFQTDHPYASSMDRFWKYTNDTAAAISVTFSEETEFESNYDYLYIYDETGIAVGTYTGTELAGQTVKVEGNTVNIRVTSDGSQQRYGFAVTDIKIHYPDGWHKIDDQWIYGIEGELATGWQKVNNTWYYFDESGIMQTGWLKLNDIWYYLSPSGAMAIGWQRISNVWYYFNAGGAMATGWLKLNNTWYYFNPSGAMVTGWQKISNVWYYFNTSGGMVTGWQKISNVWYYFNAGGAMATGWHKIGSTWYYFVNSGAMKTGWLYLNSKWYYFESSGAMVTGTKTINGKTYRFNSSGACLNP